MNRQRILLIALAISVAILIFVLKWTSVYPSHWRTWEVINHFIDELKFWEQQEGRPTFPDNFAPGEAGFLRNENPALY